MEGPPEQVQESDVRRLASGIEIVRLGPGNTLATYGELNALPVTSLTLSPIDTVEPTVIVPILEEIRQQAYNQLKKLRTGTDPPETFTGSACPPISDWNLMKELYETRAVDTLTQGLGPEGRDHYQAVLARNAWHFAPSSWYRWQSS